MTDQTALSDQDKTSSPGIASVEAAAERELGAFFRGELPPPAPTQESTPAPEVAPQPPTVQPPASGAPTTQAQPATQAAPPAVEPQPSAVVEDPSARKVKDIFGDGPKASEAILATNNRAAAMATKLREMGIDPQTMQPLPQAVTSHVQEPPVPKEVFLDEKVVEGEVNRLLDSDPNFVNLVRAYMVADSQIKDILSQKDALKAEAMQADLALRLPLIAENEFERDRYATQKQTAENKMLSLDLKESLLKSEQDRLNQTAARYTDRARSSVLFNLQSEARSRAEEAELANYTQQMYAEYSTSWPLALERAISDAKIPQELVEDFKEDAKMSALHFINSNDAPIDNVYAFVAQRAQAFNERLEKAHRIQSAIYGAQATARTALATGTPPSAPVAAPTPTQTSNPVYATLAQHEKALEDEARLVAKELGLFG